jgi:hypothetical protein
MDPREPVTLSGQWKNIFLVFNWTSMTLKNTTNQLKGLNEVYNLITYNLLYLVPFMK